MDWETRLGAWAAVAAVLVAVWALLASSRALARERRADFELTHLAELAETLDDHFGRHPSARIAARVRIMPAEVELPLLRLWVTGGDIADPDLEARFPRNAAGEFDFGGLDAVDWVCREGQKEIDKAVARVLEGRPGWWDWFRGRVRRRRVTGSDRS
ncbi:hypothetical protein [Kitasatospora sp. NPDC004272]